MEFNLSDVRFSKRDKEKQIKIPSQLTPELAEDLGIHIGDGSLFLCNPKKTSYGFGYAFDRRDVDYLNYVILLKQKLYNLNKYKIYTCRNQTDLRFHSLAIALFFSKIIKFPVGSKSKIIDIPNMIMNSNREIKLACLRGLVDTDFGLSLKNRNNKIYPVIEGGFASKRLIISISKLLKELDIEHNIYFGNPIRNKRTKKEYTKYSIYINGKKRVKEFLEIIQPRHNKYKKWACPDLNWGPLALLEPYKPDWPYKTCTHKDLPL